jgi:hypothetical protein
MIFTRISVIISLNKPISLFSVAYDYVGLEQHDLSLLVTYHIINMWTKQHHSSLSWQRKN